MVTFYDRVEEASTVTGAGPLTLGGANSGFHPFSIIPNATQIPYTVTDLLGNEEVGYGTYNSGTNQISRDTILSSSNGGLIVNFPGGAKTVFLDVPADFLNAIPISHISGLGTAATHAATDFDSAGAAAAALASAEAYTDASIAAIFPVSLSHGGTNANLSATGGVNQFLKQSGVGANITVGAIGTADIPQYGATSLLGNATGAPAVPTALQSGILLGTAGYATGGFNVLQATVTTNNFAQLSLQNSSNGASASTDFVVTANDGSDTTHYADFGINGSGGASAPFVAAHAAYLYSTDNEVDIGALGTTGAVNLYAGGGTATPNLIGSIGLSGFAITPAIQSATVPGPALKLTGAAHTAITASSEFNAVLVDLNTNIPQWATGAITTQRFTWFRQPQMRAIAASTCATAVTLDIEGPPVNASGGNWTITTPYSLRVASGNVSFGGTLGVTGAVSGASFSGGTYNIGGGPGIITMAATNQIGFYVGSTGNPSVAFDNGGTNHGCLQLRSDAIVSWNSSTGFPASGTNGDTALTRISANLIGVGAGSAGDFTGGIKLQSIVTDTTTGLKVFTVGGASGQKGAFFGSTPIVQPLLATGASHTVDDVITTLQNLGLCRQS